MTVLSHYGAEHRTQFLSVARAEAVLRMLAANPYFQDVAVREEKGCKPGSDRRWFVSDTPSSGGCREAPAEHF